MAGAGRLLHFESSSHLPDKIVQHGRKIHEDFKKNFQFSFLIENL